MARATGTQSVGDPDARGLPRGAGAVLRRPGLWPTAVRQALRTARPGWWRRPPFLPRPDADYLAFRLETHSGGSGAAATSDPLDLVRYLEWCRETERIRRGP